MAPERRPYHHGHLRTALIEAGLQLIAERGVRALTLREIGARVGVSRTAAYRHFGSKEELLAAIAEAGFVLFADALENARTSAAGEFAERLTAMAFAYVRFASEHPAYIEVMFGWDRGPAAPQSAAGDRAFSIVVATIEEGQSSGDVRPGDPVMLARIVWAQVHGISMLRLATDLTSAGPGDQLVRFSSTVLIAGLAPAAAL